jgi:TolA-binding protein
MQKIRVHTFVIFFFFMIVCTRVLFLSLAYSQEVEMREVEQIDFANGLFRRGMYAMAIEEYRKYLGLFEKGKYVNEAGFGVAECLFFQESYTDAVKAYKNLLENYSKFDKAMIAYLRLGQAHFFIGQYDDAFNALNRVEHSKIGADLLPTLDFYLGNVQHKRKENESAVQFLTRVIENKTQNPFAARAHLLKGDIYVENFNYDQAVKQYQNAHKRGENVKIKSLSLYKIGEAEFAAGRYKKSAETFQDLTRQYPKQEIVNNAFINLLTSHYNLGDFEKVITSFTEYEKTMQKDAQGFEAYYLTATAYVNTLKFNEALDILDRSLGLSQLTETDKTRALVKKAECFIKAQKYKKALAVIHNKLRSPAASQDRILFLKGESYYGLGEFKKALAVYKQVSEKYPGSLLADEAAWAQALTYKALGDNKNTLPLVLEYFKTGKNKENRAIALYNAILLEIKAAQKEAAITHAKSYLEEFPYGEHYEQTLFLLGGLYEKTKQYKNADVTLNRYIEEFSDSDRLTEVYFLLGYSRQISGQLKAAIEAYQSIAPAPGNKFYYSALKNLAYVYLNQANNEKAVEVFRRIITEFDEYDLSIDTFLWMAERYLEKKNYNDVLLTLNAIKDQLKEPDIRAAIAYYKAEALRLTEMHKDAVKQYDLSLLLRPDGPYASASRVGKALSLAVVKSFKLAIREYKTVIESHPEEHTAVLRARFGLGQIEEIKGNVPEAIKYYLLVAVLYNDVVYVPQALFNAGQLLEEQGRTEEAIKSYQEIVYKYPSSKMIEKAQKELEGIRAK